MDSGPRPLGDPGMTCWTNEPNLPGQLPPVTSILTPVTKSASLDARKQMTLAWSGASAMRLSGVFSISACWSSGLDWFQCGLMRSVRVRLGAIGAGLRDDRAAADRIDQDVDRAEFPHDRRDRSVDLRLVERVAQFAVRPPPGLAQFAHRAVEPLLVVVDRDDGAALLRDDVGGGAADAARRRGDQRHLVLKAHPVPPFGRNRTRACCGKTSTGSQGNATSDATRDSPAAGRQPRDAGIDPPACAAGRGSGAQRYLGQRAHHRAAQAVSALALVLRPDPHLDLGRRGDRAGAARHQRYRLADAASAAAREGTLDPAEPLRRAPDPRRRRRLAQIG